MNINPLNPAIAAMGETVGSEIKLFRSAAVTSENRASPLARSILAAFIAGTSTPALVVSQVLHAFGNPKSQKGKVLDKLSGSGDYLPGFGATRKTVSAIFGIYDNIDADAPVTTDDVTVGAGAIRPLIVAFILNEPGAPKSLRALNESVRAAIAAHAAALNGDNSEAEGEAETALAEANGEAAPVAMSLRERTDALVVAYGAATPDERAEAQDSLAALFALVSADITASGAETVTEPVAETA